MYKVQSVWAKKNVAVVLFIDIKENFDYISKTRFAERMIELRINGDLI